MCVSDGTIFGIFGVCVCEIPLFWSKMFPNCKQHMRNAMGSHFILSFSLFTEWNSVFHFAPSIIYQFQEMQFILIHWNKNVLPVKNWVMENGDDKKYVTIFNSSLRFCHTLNSHCSHCVFLTKTNKTRRSIVRLYLSYEQFELSYKLDDFNELTMLHKTFKLFECAFKCWAVNRKSTKRFMLSFKPHKNMWKHRTVFGAPAYNWFKMVKSNHIKNEHAKWAHWQHAHRKRKTELRNKSDKCRLMPTRRHFNFYFIRTNRVHT